MKRIWLTFPALIALVLASSWFASGLWGGKPEPSAARSELVFIPGETVGAFTERNRLPEKVVTEALGKVDPGEPLASVPLSQEQIRTELQQASALAAQHASKDWTRILPKFALWALFLGVAARALMRGRFDRGTRKGYYLAAVALFGVAFGADPSPMGTVKDAIVLLARDGVVFPPRLIALAAFLLSVVLANKAICAWGCQFGVLQDFVHRLNRNQADTAGVLRQFKVPFAVSNSVRVTFFLAFTVVAIVAGVDLVEYVDPFRTFNPAHLGLLGAVAVGVLLVASLFVYRPWCHFFCPFGLVGWLLERLSLHRIRVDESACTQCGACARACPSDAMDAILHKRRVLPDCFSCGTCMETCPSKAISFGRRRR